MVHDGFAPRLQQALKEKQVSAASLAERVGVTAGAVSQWAAGAKKPRRETAEAVAAALDVDVAWLEYGSGTGPAPDLDAERARYRSEVGWAFRPVPPDGGMDFGNANVWAFDPDLEIFAREVLQNILDVVRGQTAAVTFRLMRLRGARLERFREALGWNGLEQHLEASAAEGQKFGRSIETGLARVRETEELLVLRVEEHGTRGLTGAETGRGSNFAALCRNNLDSQKSSAGAGGAFGLGKAVLWRASSLATVLFNSDLAIPEDGKQEGRFLGRTELSFHRVGEGSFAGPGWFGELTDGHAESYWGNRALAQDLCLERTPGAPGTSTLVVGFHDPKAEAVRPAGELADKLVRAVAVHFWPALRSGRLDVTVEVADGPEEDDLATQTRVLPGDHVPEFADLLAKYEDDNTAETLDQEGDTACRRVSLTVPARRDERHGELEHSAVLLVRRAADEEDRVVAGPDRVAFYRGPGMVVQYVDLSNIRVGARPFHAAVLCGRAAGDNAAGDAAEEFLRLSEPPAHHRWERTPDLAALYARGSKAAIDCLHGEVREAIRELVGPASQDLSDGPRGLKELLRVTGKTEEPPRPRVTRATGEVDEHGRWCVRATITVKPDQGTGWRGKPIVVFDAETGGGTRVRWTSLEATKNCIVEDGNELLIKPGKRRAEFRGITAADSHPVPAHEAAITVDFRAAEPVRQEAA